MDYSLLTKLRKKYENAAKEYGEGYFNGKELESRITHLLTTKGSLEIFLTQEMEFYHKMEAMAQAKREEKEKRREFKTRVERIIAENDAKIEKYPDAYFNPAASYEIRKITGAITQWIHFSYPVIKHMFRGSDHWDEINKRIADLERFYQPHGLETNVFLKHYINEITVFGEGKREAVERKILQTAGNCIFSLSKILASYYRTNRERLAGRLVQLLRSEDLEVRDRWAEKTEENALEEIVSQLNSIVEDFRLTELAKLEYKNARKKEKNDSA